MPKDCPKCGLVNPTEAQRCDCGYDFVTRSVKHSYLTSKQLPKAAGLGLGGAILLYIAFRTIAMLLR